MCILEVRKYGTIDPLQLPFRDFLLLDFIKIQFPLKIKGCKAIRRDLMMQILILIAYFSQHFKILNSSPS